MLATSPESVKSPAWHEGFALDFQTLASPLIGHDECGVPIYDTQRSELGDAVYQLKHGQDKTKIAPIVECMADFVNARKWSFNLIVPIPPMDMGRKLQPVWEIAALLARELKTDWSMECLVKIKNIPELKKTHEFGQREALLADAFRSMPKTVKARRILLIDDIFRSGATAEAAATSLTNQGQASGVYFLSPTRTKSSYV